MIFHRPTPAEERAWRQAADRWEAQARGSARAQSQAELPKGQEEVFQLKIMLEGSKPPIWRRVLVPAALKLPDLHGVIQVAMGWQDIHLYHFVVGTRPAGLRFYGDSHRLDIDLIEAAEGRFIDDLHVPVDHLLVNEKDWIRYEYDFGDGWIHRLTLEKILVQPLREARLPRCIAGRRACPPEDIGGVPRYEHALAVLADSSHPEHQELHEWLGGPFDSERFDREVVSGELLEAFGPKPRAGVGAGSAAGEPP
jgi:hypothetical protein